MEHDAYLRGRQYASQLLIETWVIFGSRVTSSEAGVISHGNAGQVPGDIAVYSSCSLCSTMGPDMGGQLWGLIWVGRGLLAECHFTFSQAGEPNHPKVHFSLIY